MRDNFVELWKANKGQAYENKLLTRKEIVEKYSLASEENFQYLEASGFEPIAIFFTELHLLNVKKLELGSRDKVGLRDLEAFDTTLAEINEDIGAIYNEIRIQVEAGRVKAYYAARALQNEKDMKEFEALLSEFSEIYSRIESHGSKINDLISVGAGGTMFVQNGLKYMQALLKRGRIHNLYRETYK